MGFIKENAKSNSIQHRRIIYNSCPQHIQKKYNVMYTEKHKYKFKHVS